MWTRVFLRSDDVPRIGALVEHWNAQGLSIIPHFKGDDLGWTEGELQLPQGAPVHLARWLTIEDDLRDDLNAYAAELETFTYSPHAQPLMERMIQTRQLITLRRPVDGPDEVMLERVIRGSADWFAQQGDGIVQVDNAGWFDAHGLLLIQEY